MYCVIVIGNIELITFLPGIYRNMLILSYLRVRDSKFDHQILNTWRFTQLTEHWPNTFNSVCTLQVIRHVVKTGLLFFVQGFDLVFF